MANESHITKTLEDLRQQLSAKLREARSLVSAMNTLEELAGLDRTVLSEVQPDSALPADNHSQNGAAASIGARAGSQGRSQPRPDQYLGRSPLDAAKAYIAEVGHAAHLDEIAEAIQNGGAAVRGVGWREQLETSLTRAVYEVVKVQEKTFGLRSFYSDEQIAGLRGTRRSPAPVKTKPKKLKAKRKKPHARAKSSGTPSSRSREANMSEEPSKGKKNETTSE